MIIALASPRVASSVDEGLDRAERLVKRAAHHGAEIVCFPEAYVPGLRGQDFAVSDYGTAEEQRVLARVAEMASASRMAIIMGMEHVAEAGRQIVAAVVDAHGDMVGIQTKNQLDPTEDAHYVPGRGRRLFEVNGVTFGVAICHEGWRYPETVRWAAARGAKIVFHPQLAGGETGGVVPKAWGDPDAPYYEKAMMMRSIENAIYFASVNYAVRFQEAATSLIDPSGRCQAHLPYGEEGVLVAEINPALATGHLAARYAPARHRD